MTPQQGKCSSMNDKLQTRLVDICNRLSWKTGTSRHAAAIIYKKKVLAYGWNKKKTHPLCVEYQPNPERFYLHAEMDAIIKTMNKHGEEILKDCDLYVLRIGNGGNVRFSKPCEGCMNMINAVGIKGVYWT